MLIREVIGEFGDRVQLRTEDFGDSPLAEEFGIQEYPAVFVEDALVARPQDFHKWDPSLEGRYLPWNSLEKHKQFQDDLRHFLVASLEGKKVEGFRPDQVAQSSAVLTLPDIHLTSLQGDPVDLSSLRGKMVLVDFWASWCPPCMKSLDFLNDFARQHAPQVVILGIAVNSAGEAVESVMEQKNLVFPVVLADEELPTRFGSVVAIPTMMIYDAQGRRVEVIYGAAPDLHARIEARVGGER